MKNKSSEIQNLFDRQKRKEKAQAFILMYDFKMTGADTFYR